MCSFEEHDDGNGHAYSLNFIEVRDSGELFAEEQLKAARRQIRSAREDGQRPIVFIYVHGWHNNAGPRGYFHFYNHQRPRQALG
jgi:hypothetical protein